MSYVAIASAVIGAAGSAYSASQQKKAAEKSAAGSGASFEQILDFVKDNPNAFGTKPDTWNSINYTPLYQQDPGYATFAGQVIAGNQSNFAAASDLSRDVNAYATEDARTRMDAWYPGFASAFGQQQQNTANLLAGVLPWEDIQTIGARRTETNSLLGGAGNSQQVAADLGLTRLQLMQQGQAGLNSNADLVSRIDPFARRIMPQSMFVDTGQAMGMAVQENWQDYQADAAERDAAFAYESMADPFQQGMLNILSGGAGISSANAGMLARVNSQANQQMGQDFSKAAMQIASAYLGSSSGGTGAWGSSASAVQANPAHSTVSAPAAVPIA